VKVNNKWLVNIGLLMAFEASAQALAENAAVPHAIDPKIEMMESGASRTHTIKGIHEFCSIASVKRQDESLDLLDIATRSKAERISKSIEDLAGKGDPQAQYLTAIYRLRKFRNRPDEANKRFKVTEKLLYAAAEAQFPLAQKSAYILELGATGNLLESLQ
jgi:hypothetical protein